MKTIKIFLASSEELDYDRMAFGNLVRKLDKIYEKRGIRIELFEWEDYDAAFNGVRKQDEYNDYVRNSDMFLALFHTKAGKFTIEEFDIATEEFKKHASPKVYTYCKDLQPGEEESPELAEFKKRLFDEMGHYWCRYDNNDSMQLHFVMQLQLVENSQSDALKVENGEVTLDGHHIASMDKLKFAAANEDYVKMVERLASLSKDIEGLRMALSQLPDNEFLNNSLQEKLNEYNKLKEEFAEYQRLLFDTAKRVAQLQGERITERMRRAIEAFERGDAQRADAILDEAEHDADEALADIRMAKEVGLKSLEELILKASVKMANGTIPIDERVEETLKIYEKADALAKEVDYDKEKYIKLLFKYGDFLKTFGYYDKALDVSRKLIVLCEKTFGISHPETASSYAFIGVILGIKERFQEALEYDLKALDIRETVLDENSLDIAHSLNSIGGTYLMQRDFSKAFDYYLRALDIIERVYGKEHPESALLYENLGILYFRQGNDLKALHYYQRALDVFKKEKAGENKECASLYFNLGHLYYWCLHSQPKSLECFMKSMRIYERELGKMHPSIYRVYDAIGFSYREMGDLRMAVEYGVKANLVLEKTQRPEFKPYFLSCYDIAQLYEELGDYQNALKYYNKAIGNTPKDDVGFLVMFYNDLGSLYVKKGERSEAVEWYMRAKPLAEKNLELEPDSPRSYDNLATTYQGLGQYGQALELMEQCLTLKQQPCGASKASIKETEDKINALKELMKKN